MSDTTKMGEKEIIETKAKKVAFWFSLLKILIGVAIGIGCTLPAMYAVVNSAVEKAVSVAVAEATKRNDCIDFMTAKYGIDCILDDMKEFPDDLRPMDLEYVINLWDAVREEYKTPVLKTNIEQINEFYKKIKGGERT